VFFRSGWTKNDTMIFFKCGEGLACISKPGGQEGAVNTLIK
jgi:hypothetical protein